jgi:hypothetical protein
MKAGQSRYSFATRCGDQSRSKDRSTIKVFLNINVVPNPDKKLTSTLKKRPVLYKKDKNGLFHGKNKWWDAVY